VCHVLAFSLPLDIVASTDHTSFSSSSCFLRTQLNDPAHTLFVLPSPPRSWPSIPLFTNLPASHLTCSDSPHYLCGSLSCFNIFSSVVFQPGLCPLSPFNFVVSCCLKSTCVPTHSVPCLKNMIIISQKRPAERGTKKMLRIHGASSPEEVGPIEIQSEVAA